MDPEDLTQYVGNFAQCSVGLYCGKDVRHEVIRSFCRSFERAEGIFDGFFAATRPHCRQRFLLGNLYRFLDLEKLRLRLVLDGELVDADDDQIVGLDRPLVGISGILNFLLLEPAGDSFNRAAKLVDLLDILESRFFDLVGERFDKETAGKRVYGIGSARLVCDDLLRP